jgi:hypothetical protein
MPIISGGRIIEGSGTGAPLLNAGPPTNNVTYVGIASVGSVLIDTTNGQHYICTVSNGTTTVTWVKTGTQV